MQHRHALMIPLVLMLGTSLMPAMGQVPSEAGGPPGQTQRSAEPVLQTPNPRYEIRVGDTFEIIFRFTPDFNQTVTVQPDGYVNLRELPDLHVAGKTTPELTQIFQKNYSRILHDPVVTVVLKDFEKPYFIAHGELGHPGKYELRGDTTVVEAIGIAGGFNEKIEALSGVAVSQGLESMDGGQKARHEGDARQRGSERRPPSSSRRHDLRAQERAFQNQSLYTDRIRRHVRRQIGV